MEESIPNEMEQNIENELNTDENVPGTEHLNAPVAEEDPITKLEADLQEQKDKYLRLMAEFDNYRRRTSKERLELIQTAGKDGMARNRVRADHYLHWLALIAAAVWVGTIYGFLAGIGALIGLMGAISLTKAAPTRARCTFTESLLQGGSQHAAPSSIGGWRGAQHPSASLTVALSMSVARLTAPACRAWRRARG